MFKDLVGTPHPKMAVRLDVESWGGQIRGDRSAGINAAYDAVGAFVGSTAKVIGYGNVGDLNSLWPNKPPGIRWWWPPTAATRRIPARSPTSTPTVRATPAACLRVRRRSAAAT
jgi:hypothetical protein